MQKKSLSMGIVPHDFVSNGAMQRVMHLSSEERGEPKMNTISPQMHFFNDPIHQGG
jgi:hypothetical protein